MINSILGVLHVNQLNVRTTHTSSSVGVIFRMSETSSWLLKHDPSSFILHWLLFQGESINLACLTLGSSYLPLCLLQVKKGISYWRLGHKQGQTCTQRTELRDRSNIMVQKYLNRYKSIGPVELLTIILYCLCRIPKSCKFNWGAD